MWVQIRVLVLTWLKYMKQAGGEAEDHCVLKLNEQQGPLNSPQRSKREHHPGWVDGEACRGSGCSAAGCRTVTVLEIMEECQSDALAVWWLVCVLEDQKVQNTDNFMCDMFKFSFYV